MVGLGLNARHFPFHPSFSDAHPNPARRRRRPVSALIADYLRTHQYEVDRLFDGTDAVATIVARHPGLLLDINLPGKDGFEICRDARTQYDGIVIMMTARDEQFDELLGLEFGADDFLHKPIEPRILLARIKAHLRRVRMRPDDVEPASPHRFEFGKFRSTGPIARCVFPTAAHRLTSTEFDLLWALVCRAGEVVSRKT